MWQSIMHILRPISTRWKLLGLGLLSSVLVVGFETVDPAARAVGQPSSPEQRAAEREARLKAFAKTTIPGKQAPRQ
jgi:hypothetical protein